MKSLGLTNLQALRFEMETFNQGRKLPLRLLVGVKVKGK